MVTPKKEQSLTLNSKTSEKFNSEDILIVGEGLVSEQANNT